VWSCSLGWGIALAYDGATETSLSQLPNVKSDKPVKNRLQIGQDLYLENCATCHVPLPPGVLPTETWQTILEKPEQHYGTSLKNLIRLTQVIIWEYLRTFSRPLLKDEPQPMYISQSRYFKALHPGVELPKPLTIKTCIGCHPGAEKFDYLTLSPQFRDK
jgi:hypothetical protein